ncbi:MAG: hypothetical protein WCP66_11495 [Methylococcales bacterium]
MNQDLQRFSDLLPFYVNGTLSEADKAFFESYLLKHPEAQDEVYFTQRLRTAVKAVGSERSEQAGLERLLSAVRLSRKTTKTSLLDRWQQHFRDWGFTPAFVTVTILMMIQSTVLIERWSQDQAPSSLTTYRNLPEMSTQAHLKIIIRANANFSDVVMLLRQAGCNIVNGPSESGEIWLNIDDINRLAEVSVLLKASAEVADVLVIAPATK